MNMTTSRWVGIGALLMMLAVGAGAFGAHALKDILDDYSRGIYEKALFYHFIHAFAITVVALLCQGQIISHRALGRIAALLLFGVVVFSGSLYALALTGIKWLGAITPIGGVTFLLAWGLLTWETLTKSSPACRTPGN